MYIYLHVYAAVGTYPMFFCEDYILVTKPSNIYNDPSSSHHTHCQALWLLTSTILLLDTPKVDNILNMLLHC